MNQFAAQVRHGQTKARRLFITTTRKSTSHREAWERLSLTRSTFYRLLYMLRDEGTLV